MTITEETKCCVIKEYNVDRFLRIENLRGKTRWLEFSDYWELSFITFGSNLHKQLERNYLDAKWEAQNDDE